MQSLFWKNTNQSQEIQSVSIEEGIYIAKLDVDMLRAYRKREVWGRNHRRPELYGPIADEKVEHE